jgi:hypothetical protein
MPHFIGAVAVAIGLALWILSGGQSKWFAALIIGGLILIFK